ncbi:MAG: hypothetical protein ACI4TK_13935 [Agathobacter sp.]
MIEIQQALWGYSGGHHLLASSVPLSNQSIKVLGPLTDLSGSEMVNSFDGYLTGCPLESGKYYALSKTWYANEMNRPGCVWTHTLLLDYSSIPDLRAIDIESLFQRPNSNVSGWKDEYCNPIRTLSYGENELNIDIDLDVYATALKIFSLMTHHLEPILIPATNVDTFNRALELLITTTGLDFFRDFSFCTGSFSNRTINRVQLDLQIVPGNLSKLISRTSQKDTIYVENSKNCSNLNEITINRIGSNEEFNEIKEFIFFCNSQYYKRNYWLMFEKIYKSILNLEYFSVNETMDTLQDKLSEDEIPIVMEKIFEKIFSPSKCELERNAGALMNVLFDFLTSDQGFTSVNSSIEEKTLINALEWLWTEYRQQMVKLLPQLMGSNLNKVGEIAVKCISTFVETSDYSQLLQQNSNVCLLMLRFNWKLALCEDLWKQSKNIQVEALRELRNVIDELNIDKNTFNSIIFLIFKISTYDVSNELFDAFGDSSIDAFFEWYDSPRCNNSTLELWCMLCTKNQWLSISKLELVKSPMLFKAAISVLDPYSNNVKSTSPELWERLYQRFCRDNSNYSVESEFAQFVLPIILQSNYSFSKELIESTFLTVHKILANDNMEYYRWEKLSALLPEVAWYNSWDKCKRLRKAAKLRNYDISFYNKTPKKKH